METKDLLRVLLFVFILNCFVILAYFYPRLTGRSIEMITVNITRVIDGDTFESNIGKVRLLGINTPEKKQTYYSEAKDFLLDYEGKEVELEEKGKDKYGRNLAYVYFNDKLINEEILKSGLANLYYYEKDENYEKLKKAEKEARSSQLGIWKRSKNYGCVELVELKYKEDERCKNQEQLILENNCNLIKAVLKDDANHIYDLDIEKEVFSMNFSCIWNDAGDSLYVRDESGLLLFWRY